MSLFTKKDLALLLPDDDAVGGEGAQGEPRSRRGTTQLDTYVAPKPKIDPSKKVRRHRPGQAPAVIATEEEEEGSFSKMMRGSQRETPTDAPSASTSRRARFSATLKQSDARAPRSRRGSSSSSGSDSDSQAPRKRHTASLRENSSQRSKSNSDVNCNTNSGSDSESGSGSEDDEDAADARRQLVRARMLRKKAQEIGCEELSLPQQEPKVKPLAVKKPSGTIKGDVQPVKDENHLSSSLTENQNRSDTSLSSGQSSYGESSEESSDESSSSDEETEQGELFKPVFIPKSSRKSTRDVAMEQQKEEERLRKLEEKAASRKEESKKLVASIVEKDQNALKNPVSQSSESLEEMPDDSDDINDEEAYKAWKVREMKRLKREIEKRKQAEEDEKDKLRRRNMTDRERMEENERLGLKKEKDKTKRKFLQKYYHKGVFYMDDDSIRDASDVRNREAAEPTLEDKFDFEKLPEVKQVKNFGKSGRTKYTHLVDQDTSVSDSLWNQKDRIRDQYVSRLGGMGKLSKDEDPDGQVKGQSRAQRSTREDDKSHRYRADSSDEDRRKRRRRRSRSRSKSRDRTGSRHSKRSGRSKSRSRSTGRSRRSGRSRR